MSVDITIGGTVITFPTSGTPADWAQAVDQFAQAVEGALAGIVGTFDVAPQKFVLDSVPNSVDTDIPNLSFSPTVVRGAFINYSIYRNTSLITACESGTLELIYNEGNPTGFKWETTRAYTGEAQVSFIVDDTGQIQINTAALSGTGYSAFVVYSGKALQDDY